MDVDLEGAAAHVEHKGCQSKFEAAPSKFVIGPANDASTKPADHGCYGGEASQPAEHSCCGGSDETHENVTPSAKAKYFCPMCEGVESDKPRTCPKCGMALERTTPQVAQKKTIYTCPMHPQIEQDHPITAQFAAWHWSQIC